MPYPPQPWHLHGTLVASVFRVPSRLVPREHLPHGARLISMASNTFIAVAFVNYEPGGVLSYQELFVASPVWYGGLSVSVPQIWVDSEPSQQGGRELWAIPKQLARFGQGASIASVTATSGVPLPGRWTVRASTSQRLDNRDVRTSYVMSGRLRLARTIWQFPIDGELGYLAGRTPLLSLRLRDMRLTFGTAS